MKTEPSKILMEWGRDGLHISQAGRKIALMDITEISFLKIGYGDDLEVTPEGWFCTKKERIIKWMEQNEKGGICG